MAKMPWCPCARRAWDFGNHHSASRASRTDLGCDVFRRRGYALADGCRFARKCACAHRVRGIFGLSRSPGCDRGKSRRCECSARYSPSDILGRVGDGSDRRYRQTFRHGRLKIAPRRGFAPRVGTTRAENRDGVAMIPRHLRNTASLSGIDNPSCHYGRHQGSCRQSQQPARLHAQIPHSVLPLVPDVGHMLHYAVPEEVAEAVEEAGGSVKTPRKATSAQAA